MILDRSTLRRNVLPLERDGLIRIEPSAADARSKELQLTRKGAARLDSAFERSDQDRDSQRYTLRL